MRVHRGVTAGVALLTAAALTACGGGVDAEGGFGLPELAPDDIAEVLDTAGTSLGPVEGALEILDNGCHSWSGTGDADGAWIVWPEGAGLDGGDGGRVRLAGGGLATDGTALTGSGAVVSLDDLPGGTNPDSYFGSFGGFCDAADRGVLLLAEVAR